jgi:hypothetical protein
MNPPPPRAAIDALLAACDANEAHIRANVPHLPPDGGSLSVHVIRRIIAGAESPQDAPGPAEPSATTPGPSSCAQRELSPVSGPAERLCRAADLLEHTADAATPGPWQPEYALATRHVQAVFVECDGDDCGHDLYGHADGTCAIGAMHTHADNQWAILTGPPLAAPLAAWLRDAADLADVSAYGLALAVADVILAGAQ